MNNQISWREIAQGVQHQKLLVALTLVTINAILRQLKECNVVTSAEWERCREVLREYDNKDLTYLQDTFHIEINTTRDVAPSGQPVRLSALLRVLNKSRTFKANRKLEFLSWRFRELTGLLRILRDARNAAAHDFSDRPEIGWNLTIFSAYLRVLEVAVVPTEFDEQIDEKKTIIASAVLAFLKKMDTQQTHNDVQIEPKGSQGTSDQIELLAKIDQLQGTVSGIEKQINAIGLDKHRLSSGIEGPSVPSSASDDETDVEEMADTGELATNIETAITETMLRQQLENIRADIDTHFAMDEDWSGVASNILQKPIIGILMRKGHGDLAKLFADEEVSWRYERHKTIMDKQLVKFRTRIDHAISNVIWDDKEL